MDFLLAVWLCHVPLLYVAARLGIMMRVLGRVLGLEQDQAGATQGSGHLKG